MISIVLFRLFISLLLVKVIFSKESAISALGWDKRGGSGSQVRWVYHDGYPAVDNEWSPYPNLHPKNAGIVVGCGVSLG